MYVSLRVFQRNICLSAEIFRGICVSSQLENLLLLLGRRVEGVSFLQSGAAIESF